MVLQLYRPWQHTAQTHQDEAAQLQAASMGLPSIAVAAHAWATKQLAEQGLPQEKLLPLAIQLALALSVHKCLQKLHGLSPSDVTNQEALQQILRMLLMQWPASTTRLQHLHEQLQAAVVAGMSVTAHVEFKFPDGRPFRGVAYLDEHGEFQLAEHRRPQTGSPYQGAVALIRSSKGELLYPRETLQFTDLIWVTVRMRLKRELKPLSEILGGKTEIRYQLIAANTADTFARHAKSHASLRQALMGGQMDLEHEEAQVWAVDHRGEPVQFHVRYMEISPTKLASNNLRFELLTDPPLPPHRLAALHSLRYVVQPRRRPALIEREARQPMLQSAMSYPTKRPQSAGLGTTYFLDPKLHGNNLNIDTMEQTARAYFKQSDLAELRINVLGVAQKGRPGYHDHYQLHLSWQEDMHGGGREMVVRYLDSLGRVLPLEDVGVRLAHRDHDSGVVLDQRRYANMVFDMHSVNADGQPNDSLYEDSLAIQDLVEGEGLGAPTQVTSQQAVVAQQKIVEETLKQPDSHVTAPFFIGDEPEAHHRVRGPLHSVRPGTSYRVRPKKVELLSLWTRYLQEYWVIQRKGQGMGVPRAVNAMVGVRVKRTNEQLFFQVRSLLTPSAEQQVEFLDLDGVPLPVDFLKRRYVLSADGTHLPLHEVIPYAENRVAATFGEVPLPAAVNQAPQLLSQRRVPVPQLPLKDDGLVYQTASQVERHHLGGAAFYLSDDGKRNAATWAAILDVKNLPQTERSKAILVQVAGLSKQGDKVHFLVWLGAQDHSQSRRPIHRTVEYLDLYGQPLARSFWTGQPYVHSEGPPPQRLELPKIQFEKLLVKYQLVPSSLRP